VDTHDGDITMRGEECVLFCKVFAVDFRMRELKCKRDVHWCHIVFGCREGKKAGNHVCHTVEVGLRTVHAQSVGMDRFVVVYALAFRRSKIDVRLGVVVRQFGCREIACCESSWVGTLGLEIIAKLGMEGFWAGEAWVHVEPEPHRHEIYLLDRTR
jgi:hypothetical protein